MSSSSSSSAPPFPWSGAFSTVGLASLVAAVALYHLRDSPVAAVEAALLALQPTEQLALLALLFALVFGSVGFSQLFMISTYSAPPPEKQSTTTTTTTTTFRSTPPAALVVEYPWAQWKSWSNDAERFQGLYDFLRDDIMEDLRTASQLEDPEAVTWVRHVMDYNCPGGKQNRGLAVMAAARILLSLDHDNDNKSPMAADRPLVQAAILGWALEFMQAFFLVADDVMDDSKTRRGQLCYFRLPQVGLIAINDALLLESFVMTLLRRHFAQETYYVPLMELFLDIIQKTEVGQLYDLTSQLTDLENLPPGGTPAKKVDFDRFTMARYQRIVKYKTAFYSFYAPVALAMTMAGMTLQEHGPAFDQAKEICCSLGEYFQIQDDYLDCFGDPAVIGKIGTDIQENKCSWLVVQALQRCTPAQRQVLRENYGQWNDAKVAVVKKLYRELQLEQVFADYEEESYRRLTEQVNQVTLMPRQVFDWLLQKIYKRSK